MRHEATIWVALRRPRYHGAIRQRARIHLNFVDIGASSTGAQLDTKTRLGWNDVGVTAVIATSRNGVDNFAAIVTLAKIIAEVVVAVGRGDGIVVEIPIVSNTRLRREDSKSARHFADDRIGDRVYEDRGLHHNGVAIGIGLIDESDIVAAGSVERM